jgi:hypothetical protein
LVQKFGGKRGRIPRIFKFNSVALKKVERGAKINFKFRKLNKKITLSPADNNRLVVLHLLGIRAQQQDMSKTPKIKFQIKKKKI